MYTLLLALIYLAFVSLGLPDSLLGAAWPVMRVEMELPSSFAGIISMIISAGTIVSSLLSERLTKKLGTRAVTVASVFLTAISLFGFSLSKSFLVLSLHCFLRQACFHPVHKMHPMNPKRHPRNPKLPLPKRLKR